jgi:hypothetical protein
MKAKTLFLMQNPLSAHSGGLGSRGIFNRMTWAGRSTMGIMVMDLTGALMD